MDYSEISRRRPQSTSEPPDDDEDVAEERERVLSGDADDDLVCLKNLTKVKNNTNNESLYLKRRYLLVNLKKCLALRRQ